MAFNNDRNGRGGGFRSPRPSYGGAPRFGGGSDRPREMHQAICATCGKECSVPFRPSSGKPVYCSDCFEKNGGGSERRNFNDRPPERNFNRPEGRAPEASFDRQFSELNAKLDNILKILTPLVAESTDTEAMVDKEDEEDLSAGRQGLEEAVEEIAAEEVKTASVEDSGESKEKPAKKVKKALKKKV